MKKIFMKLGIIIIFLFLIFGTRLHIVKADDILAFEKNEFVFDSYLESTFLNMTIPTGYSNADLKFHVENEDIVKITNYATVFGNDDDGYDIAMESKCPGETIVKVTIDNTNYEAQCNVKVINPITINWEKKENNTVVSIQNKCSGWFLDTDYQAVEMKLINLENNSESDWIQLGKEQFGIALNETYTYNVENNKDYKILVRWINMSPYFQEDYGEMKVENQAIIYGKPSDVEPPIDIVDKSYDFFANKKEINLDKGTSDMVEIIAKLKDGYSVIQIVEMVKDNWDVEWKVEDESIAKCIPEKGIENNINGITQIAGRTSIQGIKPGTTYLVAKIKLSTDKSEEIKIPITVRKDKLEDKTIALKQAPKAGESRMLLICTLIFFTISAIYIGRKLKDNKIK